MAEVQISEKKGKVNVMFPGNRLRLFEPDGDLVASNGSTSDKVHIKIYETDEYLVFDVDWDDIYKADGVTNWGTNRDTTVTNLNADVLDRGLPYQLGVGQRVVNDSGLTLNAGTPVTIQSVNAQGAILVDQAKASDSTKMPAHYVLLERLTDGETGEATSHGLVKDLDTSSYQVGTKLYVAPAGGLTVTAPTGSNIVQLYGTVQRSSSTEGEVLVHSMGADESRLADVATSGDYNDLSNLPQIPSDTHIGNTDLTVVGSRTINMYTSYGTLNFMRTQYVALLSISGPTSTVHIKGTLKVDAPSVSGGFIQLEEYGQNGNNYIELRAPSSIASNFHLVFPSSDGTNGQALVTDGSGNLSFSTISGGSSSTIKHFYSGGAQLAYPYSRYLPLTGDVIEQNTSSSALSRTGFIAPYDGEVKKIIARSQEALGNTVLQWYKATDGTHAPATSLQSVTVNIDTANTSETYTYTTATFSKGDILSLKVDPTNDPVSNTMEFNYIIEFEFDTST